MVYTKHTIGIVKIMIGFNHIGRLGRSSNQMFQYAALRGIAANAGVNFCFPYYKNAVDDGLGNDNRTELFDFLEMSSVNELNIQSIDSSRSIIPEEYFHYNKEVHENCPDSVSLFGFFQSEKYFKNVENIIREDFTFKEDIRNPCQEMMSELDGQVIGLHIRRKDYLTNPNHCALDISYYEEALSRFPDDATVIVFSDDSAWCHDSGFFSEDRFLIAEDNSGYVDQCLMSMCSDFIIANSSFSWWAAWLGNKGKVIAPKRWFPADDKDTSDIYCQGWEVI